MQPLFPVSPQEHGWDRRDGRWASPGPHLTRVRAEGGRPASSWADALETHSTGPASVKGRMGGVDAQIKCELTST